MSKDLREKLVFFRTEAAKKANPRARMQCGFALLEEYVKTQDYLLVSGSRELSAVCEVAVAVLLTVRSLDRLLTSREWAEGLGTRRQNQIGTLQNLLKTDATQADFVEAIDLANNRLKKNAPRIFSC